MKMRLRQELDLYLGGLLIFILRPICAAAGRVMGRDHDAEVRKSLCVIKMLGGGSLVIAYPALLGLRKRYPDVQMTLITLKSVVPFAQLLKIFDRVVVIDDSSLSRLVVSGLAALFRCFRVDTIVDLEVYSQLTTIFSLLTCARNRLGFYLDGTFWKRRLHTHLVFFNRFAGSYHFYEDMAAVLKAPSASLEECRAHFPIRRTNAEPALIAVGCECSDLSKERMLSATQWAAVFKRNLGAAPAGHKVIFLGSPAGAALADEIIALVRDELPAVGFENLCGQRKLGESIALVARSTEYWGIDSALIHFARLLGVPSLSFWGPTHPETLLKPFPISERVIYKKKPCSPCVHIAETPPCGGRNHCISDLFLADAGVVIERPTGVEVGSAAPGEL